MNGELYDVTKLLILLEHGCLRALGERMQTFLPYPDLKRSARCLDNRRLGKQRVEAFTILRTLNGGKQGWIHHPAVKMWRGYENALRLYMNVCIEEWIRRGFKNTMKIEPIVGEVVYPRWFGSVDFHSSHRSNLVRKDPEFYGKYGWKENTSMSYIWPLELCPRGRVWLSGGLQVRHHYSLGSLVSLPWFLTNFPRRKTNNGHPTVCKCRSYGKGGSIGNDRRVVEDNLGAGNGSGAEASILTVHRPWSYDPAENRWVLNTFPWQNGNALACRASFIRFDSGREHQQDTSAHCTVWLIVPGFL